MSGAVRWSSRLRVRAAILLAGLIILGSGVLSLELIHGAYCRFQGRDGWVIELPRGRVTAERVERVVRSQSSCVPVVVTETDGDRSENGYIVNNLPPRAWVAPGGHIRLTVESEDPQAIDDPRVEPERPRPVPQ